MVRTFSLDQVNDSAASFDPDKLLWVNEQWLRRIPSASLAPMLARFFEGVDLQSGPPLEEIVEVQRHRASTLAEMAEKSSFIYSMPDTYAPKAARQHLRGAALPALQRLSEELGALAEWTVGSTQSAVEAVAAQLQLKMGKVAQPVRVAVTGDSASPGIGQTLALIGRAGTLRRLDRAIEYVQDRMARSGQAPG